MDRGYNFHAQFFYIAVHSNQWLCFEAGLCGEQAGATCKFKSTIFFVVKL